MKNFSKIRKDFPLLTRLINKKQIVYLDSTASSLKPRAVIEAINKYYRNYSVNIFRGVYTLSEEATAAYESARGKIAQFIGAKNGAEIVFVRGATEAINLVASTWGQSLDAGDEIVTTVMEHHANIVPWQNLSIGKGVQLRFWNFDGEGILNIADLDKLITRKTKLLTFTYVSNVLGTINPLKEIINKAKSLNPKLKVMIDAAQAVPHMKVDVTDLNCDFLVFSGHKMLGPTGIGVLWSKYEILESMPPYQFGGDMIATVTLNGSTFKEPPTKFEAGTPDIAGAIGLGAAVDYLTDIGMENIKSHEREITKYALGQLSSLSYLRIMGPKDAKYKGGIIAFTLNGVHPHDVAQILDRDNICIRSGHHCAMPLHTRLNLTASCRASFYVYNTGEDVDMLVAGLMRVKEVFK